MTIEVMKQALEALELHVPYSDKDRGYAPIIALRQAIEQAEKQEPAEWVGLTDEEARVMCRVGPVYSGPDGVITRSPIAYRRELEDIARMAVRKAEARLKEKNV